jgi:hypothetical protein
MSASHDLAGEIGAAQGKTNVTVAELRQTVKLHECFRYLVPPP